MDRKLSLLVIVLISTLTAACAGPSAAAPSGGKPASSAQAVEVRATDMLRFEPATITVKSGTPVRLTLKNSGTLVHDWAVDNLDGKKVSVEAAGGQSATTDFTPSRPGSYEFYCSQPGHREAGMKGMLVVQ